MLEALFCIFGGLVVIFTGLATLIGIAFQLAVNIIYPMVEFILHLFGVM